MTTTLVFALLVGWLGGGAWAYLARRRVEGSVLWVAASLSGRPLRMGTAYGVARLLSWACFLVLAVAGLWRIAAAVTR